MTKITPGLIRIASPSSDGQILDASELRIEVQKEDGSWLRLQTAVELTVHAKPNELVVATIGLLTSDIDLAFLDPGEVEFVRARFPYAPERFMSDALRKAVLTIRARTITTDDADNEAYLAAVDAIDRIADQLVHKPGDEGGA